jgi:hypothetical protein
MVPKAFHVSSQYFVARAVACGVTGLVANAGTGAVTVPKTNSAVIKPSFIFIV